MGKARRRVPVEEFVRRCKAAGLSVTPQRIAIYDAIAGNPSHPSPEAVYRRIRLTHPTIALATVYKTLDTFSRHGLVALLTPMHETVRYDPLTIQHHHMICVKCKEVVDVVDPALDEIRLPTRVRRSTKVLGYSIHFNVLCPSCRAR